MSFTPTHNVMFDIYGMSLGNRLIAFIMSGIHTYVIMGINKLIYASLEIDGVIT